MIFLSDFPSAFYLISYLVSSLLGLLGKQVRCRLTFYHSLIIVLGIANLLGLAGLVG